MLYIVSTPIGNLNDISLRALETLRSVNIVASEDTRKTGLLLKKHAILTRQVAFHEKNEIRAGKRLMSILENGQSVALVCDAGTPGISDPGFTIVRSAIEAGIAVTCVPGPSALLAALLLSGLPVHAFTFRGFAPAKSAARKRFLRVDVASPHTLIFYESPHRLKKFLTDAYEVFGERPAALANDLTKSYEQVVRRPLSELIALCDKINFRGEFVVVISGANLRIPPIDSDLDNRL